MWLRVCRVTCTLQPYPDSYLRLTDNTLSRPDRGDSTAHRPSIPLPVGRMRPHRRIWRYHRVSRDRLSALATSHKKIQPVPRTFLRVAHDAMSCQSAIFCGFRGLQLVVLVAVRKRGWKSDQGGGQNLAFQSRQLNATLKNRVTVTQL